MVLSCYCTTKRKRYKYEMDTLSFFLLFSSTAQRQLQCSDQSPSLPSLLSLTAQLLSMQLASTAIQINGTKDPVNSECKFSPDLTVKVPFKPSVQLMAVRSFYAECNALTLIIFFNFIASSPCWNLASKRVGSYDLNDPLVKVTFYRVSLYRCPPIEVA